MLKGSVLRLRLDLLPLHARNLLRANMFGETLLLHRNAVQLPDYNPRVSRLVVSHAVTCTHAKMANDAGPVGSKQTTLAIG